MHILLIIDAGGDGISSSAEESFLVAFFFPFALAIVTFVTAEARRP